MAAYRIEPRFLQAMDMPDNPLTHNFAQVLIIVRFCQLTVKLFWLQEKILVSGFFTLCKARYLFACPIVLSLASLHLPIKR